MENLQDQMTLLAKRAKNASRALTLLSSSEKNNCLQEMAAAIIANEKKILEQNLLDMNVAKTSGLSSAMLDRLQLTPKRIADMARGLQEAAQLPDPVGRELAHQTRPNGLELKKIACPIGVVVIIFESRPKVTADAAGLCFKSGNATILRGGKEALHSNKIIAEVMLQAGKKTCPHFPDGAIQLIQTTDHAAVPALLTLTNYIDLCIPRGGERLIRAVMECSRVPVIKHYKGVCHIYVHTDADLQMAKNILINAKVQRPSACNAAEKLLIDESIAKQALPLLAQALIANNVHIRCDDASRNILQQSLDANTFNTSIQPANADDWSKEYLDLTITIGIVKNVQAAIDHINQFGSGHSDCIVTNSRKVANQFLQAVDSAAVYWNASTRFTDGGEFGMGAEIGISTDKIGARGPMGLEELTTYKWIGSGNGLIRK